MNARLTPRRLARLAAMLAVPAIAFALSTSNADAHPNRGWGHGHGHGHGHARCNVVRVVAPPVVVHRVIAPYRVIVPAPVVRPYPVAPVPYGTVVYDRGYDHVGGFIGWSGPHVRIGIAF